MPNLAEAQGLDLSASKPISGAMSLAMAGSTHVLLRNSVYEIWGTADFQVILTDAAHDPVALPASQAAGAQPWPGATVMSRVIFRFQILESEPVNINGTSVQPTGVRVVSLSGGAGTFYINEYLRTIKG